MLAGSPTTGQIERINKEIAQIVGPEKERITAARQERLEDYVAYFSNLGQEQETLEELYAPVSARLAGEAAAEQEQDLEFSIRWDANLEERSMTVPTVNLVWRRQARQVRTPGRVAMRKGSPTTPQRGQANPSPQRALSS